MDDELEKLFGTKKIPFRELLKRTSAYLKTQRWRFVLALFLLLLNVLINIALPVLTAHITTILKTEIDLTLIIYIVVGYFALTLINEGFVYIESMVLQKAGQEIVYNLRMEIFTHIENMSIHQLNIMPVGSLVTRVANYTQNMSQLFTDILVTLIKNVLTVIGVYSVMIYYSPTLSLIMLIVVVVVFVISYFARSILTKLFRKERSYYSEMNTFLSENISGMKIIQIFNQQKRKEKEFRKKSKNIKDTGYKIVCIFAMYRPLLNFLYYVSIGLCFYFGVKFNLDAGGIVAFYLLLSRFFNPIEQIADQLNHIQRATTAGERIYNLLDVEPTVVDEEDAIEIEEFKGKIEFRNVWFAYQNEDWILKDVSFVIEPKQTVAFVGATGSGKTTILSLIVRNFEVQKGTILIDDIDIKHIKTKSLRKAIGQMLQDVFLFSGDIKTNVALYDEKYSDEDVKAALEYVQADTFVDKLPDGLHSEVIERGENFSQGQRQLLNFARTILVKPQILILDEATANIDTETEVLIQESLHKMRNIGTMLIVAHRLSTIQNADNIIVINKGQIIESGKHQQLLKKKGYYYKLYEIQFNKNNQNF
ncbi:MAG: ABC transporter ATP-binding protein [Bacilli bacterium]|nr:ABC transporter ATP-binding protein [Bacilli bacterium]